jgi:hypothetical protein
MALADNGQGLGKVSHGAALSLSAAKAGAEHIQGRFVDRQRQIVLPLCFNRFHHFLLKRNGIVVGVGGLRRLCCRKDNLGAGVRV